MTKPLGPDSLMECPIHGKRSPAFICQHLQNGEHLGFFEPAEPPGQGEWPQAWCAACESVAIAAGAWNDESEGFAQFRWVCEGCYLLARKRNRKEDQH